MAQIGAIAAAGRIPTPRTPLGFMLAFESVLIAGASTASFALASQPDTEGLLTAIWIFVGLCAFLELLFFFWLVAQDPSKLMLEAKDAIAYRRLSQGDSAAGDRIELVSVGAAVVPADDEVAASDESGTGAPR